MKTLWSKLTNAVRNSPWNSLEDSLLLFSLMVVATLLALQFNLFSFADQLTEPQRRITLAEAIFLTILLAFCIFAFAIRRLRESRHEVARSAALKIRVRELRTLAHKDSLTGLVNRRALLAALDRAVASPPERAKHAFFLIDLNAFKRVNDLEGHSLGDHVLQVVAERFQTVRRPSDLLARLGGDEFAVLAYNVDRDAARKIGMRLIASLKSEIRIGGQAHQIGAAVGAAMIPDDGTTTEEIIHNADLAMYRAKAQDHSSLVFCQPADVKTRQRA